jgi:adenosylcobinamide kinase / adenosylcobinamide-phosphate guanylyltransferase
VGRVTLVTGGARSGKSSHALRLAEPFAPRERAFLATATAFDEEMRARIALHRAERGGGFVTVEEPEDVAGALAKLGPDIRFVLLDCVTVWLGNLVHRHGAERDDFPEVDAFLQAIPVPERDLVIVTNELGMGIVPENALARRFRDLAGRLNARLARAADEVIFMVSGIPMHIKSAGESPAIGRT